MTKKHPPLWIEQQPVIQQVNNRISVLRDDLLEGGSKSRFLPFLIDYDADELVFGGPFCGGAPLALSVLGRYTGHKISLFYAKRQDLHRRQIQALKNGATIFQVPHGYMSNVQAKARRYAESRGAQFLPLGFDLPQAEEPFVNFMLTVRAKIGSPSEIWCAAGSGMLARCLGKAFPDSAIKGVAVGLASRHDAQSFPANVELLEQPLKFEQECKGVSPFPTCPNYERKAWKICFEQAKPGTLFWNVLA